MRGLCHILALVFGVLAVLAAIIALATPWTIAAADTSSVNLARQQSRIEQEVVALWLWHRHTENTNGDKSTETWASYFSGRDDDRYCRNDSSKTYKGAWDRIQVAQAFAILTLIFAFIHVVIMAAYASGRLRHRISYVVTALLTIAFAVLAIVFWFQFLTYCGEDYCDLYLRENRDGPIQTNTPQDLTSDQQLTDEAYCYSFVGFAFEVIVMGFLLISTILMCFRSSPARDRDHVMYSRDHHGTHPVVVEQPVPMQHYPAGPVMYK